MALMFPRIARNFANQGFFPSDDPTVTRILSALAPGPGRLCIFDPCAGQGDAIAQAANSLGREQTRVFAVEYDTDRAQHAREQVDICIQGDLMDTEISPHSFGLLWLNPPYGDLRKDADGKFGYEGSGRPRLEKLFYQRTLPMIQHDGVLVYIIPNYVLDDEMTGWLTSHFTDLRVYQTVERRFRQVVILGRRIRARDLNRSVARTSRTMLLEVGQNPDAIGVLPEVWPFAPYTVPVNESDPAKFYRNSLEPLQLASEIHRLQGLWPMFDAQLGISQQRPRRPVRALSQWHLALAVAAGAITGVIRSKAGRVMIVRGDTHKEKIERTEYTERDDGSVSETRILTDKFVPVIRAWDMTPGAATLGQVLTIR